MKIPSIRKIDLDTSTDLMYSLKKRLQDSRQEYIYSFDSHEEAHRALGEFLSGATSMPAVTTTKCSPDYEVWDVYQVRGCTYTKHHFSLTEGDNVIVRIVTKRNFEAFEQAMDYYLEEVR